MTTDLLNAKLFLNVYKSIYLAGLLLLTVFVMNRCASKPDTAVAAPAADSTTKIDVPVVKESKNGLASYYGHDFEGQRTTSGEKFKSKEMVAAHPTYPFGTIVKVTNLETNDTVLVRIIDRGPTRKYQKQGVIIDVSKGAASKLKMIDSGRVSVKVEVMEWGNDNK
jgi:rare lipoprotein A